jgi:hypothetical protein
VVYDQRLLDLAFDDLEHLLAAERPVPVEPGSCCVSCGGGELDYAGSMSSHPGSLVCNRCGVVQPGCVFYETMYGRDCPRKTSNYKRIHHWHERVSQLLLMESQIPYHEMLRIAEKLCDGTHAVIDKDTVRSVLRSLNLQLYIEKWLQIIFRVTRIAPPIPGSLLIQMLDQLFLDLQEPFNCYRVKGRKNFLNYNYVFCRLFQKLECHQFCMFFPLIKSKQKLRQLDDMWSNMVGAIDWEVKPLEYVAPFAVHLEQPALLLQRLASEYVPPVLAGIQPTQLKTVFRTLGRRSAEKLVAERQPHHSKQFEQESQTPAVGSKRRRSVREGLPQLQRRR